MKKLFQTIFFLVLAGFSWYFVVLRLVEIKQNPEAIRNIESRIWGPCKKPLTYSLGNIDPRFEISNDEFLAIVEKAEKDWESKVGKDIFEYDPDSAFKINLVYDERQERSKEYQVLEEKLQEVESVQKNIGGEYESLAAERKKELDKYEKDLDEYQKDLNDYNKEVDYWNNQGGAPEADYEKLKKEKKALEERSQELEKERQQINDLTGKMNDLARKEKQIVSGYNREVSTYSDKYGASREFDQGVYTGKEINVYQFNAENDLELVMTHELGHYLGIDHLENPKSIMYYLIGEQDLNDISPTEEDLAAVSEVCK